VERVKVGSIQADNLRQAVWMMLFGGEEQELQLKAEYYPLSARLNPEVTVRNARGRFILRWNMGQYRTDLAHLAMGAHDRLRIGGRPHLAQFVRRGRESRRIVARDRGGGICPEAVHEPESSCDIRLHLGYRSGSERSCR
jgi:hypothetical protein